VYFGSLLCRASLKVTTFDCMFINRQFSEMYVNIKFTICFTYLVRVAPGFLAELWCNMLLRKSIKYALCSSRHGTLLGILQISGRRFA